MALRMWTLWENPDNEVMEIGHCCLRLSDIDIGDRQQEIDRRRSEITVAIMINSRACLIFPSGE
jgi:hypothetical protein